MSADQVRAAFAGAGYQLDQVRTWDWTSPPVTSIQVRDAGSDRVLLALVYPDAAQMVRARALARDAGATSGNPHLVPGLWSEHDGGKRGPG
jgi:hypothetical protein